MQALWIEASGNCDRWPPFAMKIIFAMLLAALLAACSTSPVRPDNAKLVPPDRLYITAQPSPSDGLVIVVRDTGMLGSGCGVNVFLDGKKAAFLAAGEKAEFPASAGKHMLSMAPSGKGLCGIGDAEHSQKRSLIFDAVAGKRIDFRVGLSAGGDPVFYQTSM